MDGTEENGLSSLLQNPELLEKVKSALGDAALSSETLDAGLSSALQNPELLSKLPAVMSLLKPMLGTSAAEPDKPARPESERDRLLIALRPFLSKERQEMVESILRLSQLGDVLRHLS